MPLIENLQITNFKCFKQLEIKGLGQVNLIGGKNNVGKTAFLEAVELFLSTKNTQDLAFMLDMLLKRRQQDNRYRELDFFGTKESIIKISHESKYCQIKWRDRIEGKLNNHEVSLSVKINGDRRIDEEFISISDFSESDTSNPPIWQSTNRLFNFISSAKSKEQDIAILLGKLVDIDKEEYLNQSLSLFDRNVIAIKQIATEHGVVLKLKVKNQTNLVLLSSLGEGINRYIAILCAIWANKDGFLLIDEIENGIHFTNYPKLWEIIFKVSVEANCQLFITTHSKECITAFNDMQFEVENCNAQYFELYRNQKTDLITSFARDKEQLRYALTHEGKVRGE